MNANFLPVAPEMNVNFLPVPPRKFIVIDRWVGLHPRTEVYVFDTAAEAGESVADSLDTIEMLAEMDPIELDIDYDWTWLESVHSLRS